MGRDGRMGREGGSGKRTYVGVTRKILRTRIRDEDLLGWVVLSPGLDPSVVTLPTHTQVTLQGPQH